MALTIVLHIMNEDPVVGEVEELPGPTDQLIKVTNPRRLDGKELHYLAPGVVEVMWPITIVNFIELMPSEEEQIVGFVRE